MHRNSENPTAVYHVQMKYFSNVGGPGPVRYRQIPRSVAVLDRLHGGTPIGKASADGRTDDDLAVWSLHVDGADVPGRWLIVDRRFVAISSDPA